MTNIIHKFSQMNVYINDEYKKMLYYDRIDVSEGIDVNKTSAFVTTGIS